MYATPQTVMGRLLVVPRKPGSCLRKLLKDVVDERVRDAHGLGRNSGVRVHLLQHLADVNLVSLDGYLHGLFLRLASAVLGAIFTKPSTKPSTYPKPVQ